MLNEYYRKYNSEDENCSRKVKKNSRLSFSLKWKITEKIPYHTFNRLCIYIYLYIAWKFETG